LFWVDRPQPIDWLLGEAASIVDKAMKCLNSNDTKHYKEEQHKNQGIDELWQTSEHDRDKSSHARHLFDASQRPQHSKQSHKVDLEATCSDQERQNFIDTADNHNEIDDVPAVPEVRILVLD
jgi:hypothetical protein